MRFEGKHKEFKQNASNVQCRKNLPLTLAKKSQLKFAFRVLGAVGLQDHFKFGKPIFHHIDYNKYFWNSELIQNIKECHEVKWYEINGISYNISDAVCYDVGEGVPQFCAIKNILIRNTDTRQCYFICQCLYTKEINSHYRAYVVVITDEYKCLELNKIKTTFPYSVHEIGGLSLISCIPI